VHRSRRTVLFGTMLTAGIVMLPIVNLPTGTVNGVEGDAWPVLILLGPVLMLFLVGERIEHPIAFITVIGILLAATALGFSIIKLVDAHRAVSDAGGTIAIGAWALPVASAVALAGALLGLSRRVG